MRSAAFPTQAVFPSRLSPFPQSPIDETDSRRPIRFRFNSNRQHCSDGRQNHHHRLRIPRRNARARQHFVHIPSAARLSNCCCTRRGTKHSTSQSASRGIRGQSAGCGRGPRRTRYRYTGCDGSRKSRYQPTVRVLPPNPIVSSN
jgi:hypothetical protein